MGGSNIGGTSGVSLDEIRESFKKELKDFEVELTKQFTEFLNCIEKKFTEKIEELEKRMLTIEEANGKYAQNLKGYVKRSEETLFRLEDKTDEIEQQSKLKKHYYKR